MASALFRLYDELFGGTKAGGSEYVRRVRSYIDAMYMKKIRIWKSAKDNEYVQNSYNGTAEVTGKEADLAAAWDFMTKPSGSGNEVIDLTGRHTAKIIGTYEWQRIVE